MLFRNLQVTSRTLRLFFFFTVYDSCTQRHAEHAGLIFKLYFCGLLFTDTCPYCVFFCYQHFLIFSHITQHSIQYNKAKQQTHTQHLKVQSKGRERGKDNKNTKVTPLYNHVYQTKNTAKHQWRRPGPTDSCRCTFTSRGALR